MKPDGLGRQNENAIPMSKAKNITFDFARVQQIVLKVGNKINLMSSAFVTTPFGGLPKQETLTVVGIFSTGFYEFDQNFVFLNLFDALSIYLQYSQ